MERRVMGKLSRTVWDGGKGGDNIKVLPIVIPHKYDGDRVHPQRHETCAKKGVLVYSGKSEYRRFPPARNKGVH